MKSPNGITTILFDLDDTLRHNEPHGHGFFLDYAASLGAPNLPDNRNNARHWAFQYWADSDHLFEDINTHGRGEPACCSAQSVRDARRLDDRVAAPAHRDHHLLSRYRVTRSIECRHGHKRAVPSVRDHRRLIHRDRRLASVHKPGVNALCLRDRHCEGRPSGRSRDRLVL